MLIYYAILISLIIGFFMDIFNSNKKNLFYKFNFILLFIFASCRYGVGADYVQYEGFFQKAKELSSVNLNYFLDNFHDIEYGYLLLESLIKQFTTQYQIMLLIMNIIMFSFLYKGIERYPNKNIQLFIFYCFIYLFYITSIYRQGIAMCILYYNLKYIEEKKFIKYLFFCILAGLFHKVSFLMIVVYFFANRKFSKKFYIVLSCISILSAYFFLTGNLIKFLNENFNFLQFVRRVHYYYFVKSNGNFNNVSFFGYLQRIILIVIVLIFKKKIPNYKSNLLILCPIIFFIFSNVGILSGRISGIFLIYYMCYFSYLLKKEKKSIKILLSTYILLYGILMFNRELFEIHPIKKNYNYIPYKCFLEEK